MVIMARVIVMLFMFGVVVMICVVVMPLLRMILMRALGVAVLHRRDIEQVDHFGIRGQRGDAVRQPGGQLIADDEDDIGLLQRGRVGGAQVAVMRRLRGRDQQVRHPGPRHDLRDQRMYRRDIRGDIGRIRHSGKRQQGNGGGKAQAGHRKHLIIHVADRSDVTL